MPKKDININKYIYIYIFRDQLYCRFPIVHLTRSNYNNLGC